MAFPLIIDICFCAKHSETYVKKNTRRHTKRHREVHLPITRFKHEYNQNISKMLFPNQKSIIVKTDLACFIHSEIKLHKVSSLLQIDQEILKWVV